MESRIKQNALFGYGHESSPIHPWLLPLILLSGLACLLSVGVSVFTGPSYFQFTHFLNEPSLYTVDPLISEYYPSSAPPVLRLFAGVADIPFYHLLVGSFTKLVMVGIFYLLAWRITRSTLASLIAVLILFGVADFAVGNYQILNLRIPIGFTTNGLRDPVYLNFRLFGMIFILGSTLLFWERRLVLASVLLAVGAYGHILNALIFFVCFCGALVVSFFMKKDLRTFLYDFLKFAFPFLVLIFPYIARSMSMFSEVTPIDFATFWSFAVINEPDDISTIWYLLYFKSLFLVGFVLTIIAGCLHLVLKSAKPITREGLQEHLLSGDLTLPLLFAPWLLLGFGIIWEAALIPFLPDSLNDIVSSLNLKRTTTVSALIYTPILAMVLSRVLHLLVRSSCVEVMEAPGIDQMKQFFKKLKLISAEQVIAVVVAFLVLGYVLCLKNQNLSTFKRFFVFDPMPYDYFLNDTLPAYQPPNGSQGKVVPVPALLDVCGWVKRNTPKEAAIIGPSYMVRTRVYCQRQGFLQEKDDGNLALFNRKFATLYIERFADIHKGLTYESLLTILEEGGTKAGNYGEARVIMRERYLSQDDTDIKRLQEKYPGYDYFLTEKSHSLDYPILFENEFLRLYDIH